MGKVKKVKAELSRDPQNLSEDTWYYEERPGICITHNIDPNDHARPIHIKIPWRKLVKSVNRYLETKKPLTPTVRGGE
jgi:hypothetical protein